MNIQYLQLAANIALPNEGVKDNRDFWIGCVGIRWDGAVVQSKNGSIQNKIDNYPFFSERDKHIINPFTHAEGRVLRKMGKDGVIYVARIIKDTREFGMARPCNVCLKNIQIRNIKKVYYSIDKNSYGLILPQENYNEKVLFL